MTEVVPFETLTEAAFKRELVANLPKLSRVARYLLKSSQGADDLVNDTVVRAMGARLSFRAGTNMGAWLAFICRNLFLTAKRKAWRTVEMAEGQAEAIPHPASQLTTVLAAEALAAMQYLPDEMREAMLIVGADGLSYEEAAELLQTQTGTIKSRVSRGRAMLADYFGATQGGQ